MNFIAKTFVCAAVFAGAAAVSAESFDILAPNFFTKYMGNTAVVNGKEIKTTGATFLVSKQKFDIDPAKKFTYKIKMAGNAEKPIRVYIGYELYDAKGKTHQAHHWQGLQSTFTELTKAAKKGDTVLSVKNGASFSLAASGHVMYNVKEDNSDIPNANIAAGSVKSKVKKGAEWELTLREPMKMDLPAGAKIRQHISGGYYYVTPATNVPVNGEITFTGTVQGFITRSNLYNGKNWPFGAKKAQLLLLIDWTRTGKSVIIKEGTWTIE